MLSNDSYSPRFIRTIQAHAATPYTVHDLVPSPIQVYFRTRPISSKEKSFGVIHCQGATSLYYPCYRVLTEPSLDVYRYQFDQQFGPQISTDSIYADHVRPKLVQILSSESGRLSILAYGQTGSGKSFTMSALSRLLVQDIFGLARISVSLIEIQGDAVRDLCVSPPKSVRVLLNELGSPVIMNLTEQCVESPESLQAWLDHGFATRATSKTAKNDTSSRSHFVCRLIVSFEQTNVFVDLVDLAGSEQASDKTSHDADRLKEAAMINSSLMALKECIRKASANSSHVPFRSSKLTMVLKDSFDLNKLENSHTILFALAAPTVNDVAHSLNTFRYAAALRASNDPTHMPREPTKTTTPMAWSRSKLEKWILAGSDQQLSLNTLIPPPLDPNAFVAPPWKALYDMPLADWTRKAKMKPESVKALRDKYRFLFVVKRAIVADDMDRVMVQTSLMLEDLTVSRPKIDRAKLAMEKMVGKGAAAKQKAALAAKSMSSLYL